MTRESSAFHNVVGVLTLLLLPIIIQGFSHGVGGFGNDQKWHQNHGAENKPLKNFHKVLEEAGKTILRPGALVASHTLHSWAKLSPTDRVLELASGLGRGGIDIARNYGCQEVLLSDMDDGRLTQACQTVKKLDLEDQMTVRKINMFKLGQAFHLPSDDPSRFNVVVTEASLSHYSMQQKARFLKEVASVCAPDQILLHEICVRQEQCSEDDVARIRKDVGNVLGIGFYPEKLSTFRKILDEAGYDLQEYKTGPLRQMNPKYVIQDEGILQSLKIARNVMFNEALRSRLLEGRNTLGNFRDNLGYIILRATRKDGY